MILVNVPYIMFLWRINC